MVACLPTECYSSNSLRQFAGPTAEDFVTDTPTDIRSRENEEIASRFQAGLASRAQRSPFSPSYINARPHSLAEKLRVTPEEEEQILYLYAATYSIHQTASTCGVTTDKVRSVIYNPVFQERIQAHRDEMRINVLQKIEEAQVVLLDALQDPDKLKNASITQISEVFTEISGTQASLITTLRETASPASEVDPARVFSGEELEYMMLLRRRLSIGAPPDRGEDPNLDAPLDFIEVEGGPTIPANPDDEAIVTYWTDDDDHPEPEPEDEPDPFSDEPDE